VGIHATRRRNLLAIKEEENSHARATHEHERGWVGALCGTRGEKSGNVAFLVIVSCFILIAVGLHSVGMTAAFFKFLGAPLGIISLTLRYLFGAHNRQ
jgi:hypothetical protein